MELIKLLSEADRLYNSEEMHYYDPGYRLIRKYWEQEIITEMDTVSLEYAFKKTA